MSGATIDPDINSLSQTGNWDESSYDISDITGNFAAMTYAGRQASNSSGLALLHYGDVD
jgi:hypothetical protein